MNDYDKTEDMSFFQRQAQAVAERGDKSAETPVSPSCRDAIAAKYDVRNISSRELSRLANELLTGGRVSREAFAMLSFQPEMNACYDVVGAQGVSRPDPDRQRDAIEEWRTILDTQEKFDNSEYFLSRTREIISLLEDLDRARRGL